jgi:hypothetical protein
VAVATSYGNPGGSTGIRVTNLRQTIRDLERAGVAVADLKDGFALVGNEVVGRSRQIAPHKTGALRASIKASRMKSGVRVQAGGRRAPYAFWWYTGTRRNRKLQFIHLAVRQTDITRLFGRGLQQALRKSGLG